MSEGWRARRSPGRAHGLWLAAALSTGCTLGARVAVLPTLQTNGEVGAEARITLPIGVTTSFDYERNEESRVGMILLPVSAGGGVANVDGAAGARFEAGAGAEYAAVGREPGALGYRAGLAAAVSLQEGTAEPYGAALFEAALLVTLHEGEPWLAMGGNQSTPTWALGPVLEAAMVGEDAVGRFGLGIGVELYSITSWTVR